MTGGSEVQVRARIIQACLVCIERKGIEALTVRTIAEEAGVNVAAINYYFGSKDRLVEEVLRQTLETGLTDNLRELDEAIRAEGGDVRAGLRRFLHVFLVHLIHYPRLAVAQLHEVLTRQDYSGPAVRESQAFVEGLLQRVAPAMPAQLDDEARRLRAVQAWSSLLLLALMPRFFEGVLARPTRQPGWQEPYAAVWVEQLLGPEPPPPERGRRKKRAS